MNSLKVYANPPRSSKFFFGSHPMTPDQKILSIISGQDVTSQSQLERLLADRGVHLTQSTLSRRLKVLSIEKQQGAYRVVNPTGESLPAASIISAPPNLVILRTSAGFAPALAYVVDQQVSKDLIAGTVAGEDTVMIAIANPQKFQHAVKEIKALLKLKN